MKLYGKEIRDEEWQKHKDFLKYAEKKVDEINKRYNFDPVRKAFIKNKPH